MKRLVQTIYSHPHLAAATLFLLLGLIFFARALLPPAGYVLAGHDMVGNYYIYWEHVRASLLAGQLPLWEPRIFGGFPFLAQPQQNTFYPPNWINLLIPVRFGVTLLMLFHVWLAGFGMYLYVRAMGGRWLPGVLAGIGFAFGGLLAGRLWAGHSPVYAVFIWTPWLLLGIAWAVRRGSLAAAVVAGVPFGLAILAGHIPSFLYVAIVWAAFVLFLVLTSAGSRALVVRQAAVAALVGLALAAVQLVPFLQFSLTSERVAVADYEFATDYSLPPAHLITLVVPEYFGEPTRVGYWSVPTFEELTYYAGGLALLGIILALRKPSPLTWFYIVLIVIGLWLALGRYGVLYELAYRFLPPFRLVRAPGRAAFLYLFAASALLGHALSQWRSRPPDENRRLLRVYWPVSLVVIGVALFAALAATGAVFMAVHPTDTSGRLWHQIGGFSLALVILMLGGTLIWAYLTTDSENRRIWVALALIVLVTTDTWWYAFKMVRLAPTAAPSVWVDGRAVVGDPGGRVLPWGIALFDQNGALQVDWPSVFGYDSLEPAAHIALASSVPDPRSTAYDILGADTVLAGGPLDDFTVGERGLSLLGQQGAAWVYRRARPIPLVRLVTSAEVIPDSAAAIARIHAPDFDPTTTAILQEPAGCIGDTPSGQTGTAEVVYHEPTLWRIRTASDVPSLLVLAENAFPGWQVAVDGAVADPLTAYTSVRAVCVPAGDHEVVWRFVPRAYAVGVGVTGFALITLFFAVWRLRKDTRRRSQDSSVLAAM